MSNPKPTLDTLVHEAVINTVTPDYIQGKVQQQVDRLVDEAIRDSLRSYSDTGKAIKEAVAESLRLKTSLDLPDFASVVTDILERQVKARVAEVVQAKLTQDMEDLLSLAPKRVKLSELVAELLGDDEERYSVFCKVKWDVRFVDVYLDEDKQNRDRDTNIQFTIHLPKRADDYENGETPEGPISFGTVKGRDLKKTTSFGFSKEQVEFGRLYQLEQKVLAMYACGTIIEIDEDDVITEREW